MEGDVADFIMIGSICDDAVPKTRVWIQNSRHDAVKVILVYFWCELRSRRQKRDLRCRTFEVSIQNSKQRLHIVGAIPVFLSRNHLQIGLCGYTNRYLILPIDQNSTFPPIAPKWMKLNAINRNKTTKIIVEVVTTDVRKIILGFKFLFAPFLGNILRNGLVDRTHDSAEKEFKGIKCDNQAVLQSVLRIHIHFYINMAVCQVNFQKKFERSCGEQDDRDVVRLTASNCILHIRTVKSELLRIKTRLLSSIVDSSRIRIAMLG